MRCLLMRRWCFGISICFNQNKPRQIITLLEEIKSRDPRLFPARLCINFRRRLERVHITRFHFYIHKDN